MITPRFTISDQTLVPSLTANASPPFLLSIDSTSKFVRKTTSIPGGMLPANVALKDAANTFTQKQTLTLAGTTLELAPSAVTTSPTAILRSGRDDSSVNQNIVEYRSRLGVTAIGSVDYLGRWMVNPTGTGPTQATVDGSLLLSTRSTASIGVVIQGIASQSGNLQEWRNSSGTALAYITSAGRGYLGHATGSPGNYDLLTVQGSSTLAGSLVLLGKTDAPTTPPILEFRNGTVNSICRISAVCQTSPANDLNYLLLASGGRDVAAFWRYNSSTEGVQIGSTVTTDPGATGRGILRVSTTASSTLPACILVHRDTPTANLLQLHGISSTSTERSQAAINSAWADSTDATRTGRLSLGAYYTTTLREAIRIDADSAGALVHLPSTTLRMMIGSTATTVNGTQPMLTIAPNASTGGIYVGNNFADSGGGAAGIRAIQAATGNRPIYTQWTTPTSFSINSGTGYSILASYRGASASGAGGFHAFGNHNTSGTVTNSVGFTSYCYLQGAAVVTDHSGFYSTGQFIAGAINTVTTVYDFRTANYGAGTSTDQSITTRYGLYLGHTKAGGNGTNAYGVYQVGTDVDNLFNGKVVMGDGANFEFNTTTGTKIGTATTQKIGFYNATPVVQGASVADATGGATVDAEARTAINALISRIEALGLIATV